MLASCAGCNTSFELVNTSTPAASKKFSSSLLANQRSSHAMLRSLMQTRLSAWSVQVPSAGMLVRMLHTSGWTAADVVMPSMGESMTEGTIAAVLKKPGDAVRVDDIIAQVETDKVTIDVRSTTSGTVEQILVASGCIIKPGELVARVSAEGTQTASSSSSAPSTSSAAASASAPSPPAAHGRIPSIRFPPRMAPSGERISSLPAAQQDQILKQLSSPTPTPVAASQAASLAAPAAAAAKPAAPVAPAAAPAKPNRVLLKEAPARRTVTEREMELINSGGAL